MKSKLLAAVIFSGLAIIAESREPKEEWSRERGITEGVPVKGSASPDKKYALFEFHSWDGQTPDTATTATGIGLAPADRSRLLFVIDSRTQWMTDRKVTSFLVFKWNSDSTLLATHDSGSRHSRLNLYRISPSGSATELEVPDLLAAAVRKLGVRKASVTASGQTPSRWRTPRMIEISVGLTTPKGKLTTTIPLQVDEEGRVSMAAE